MDTWQNWVGFDADKRTVTVTYPVIDRIIASYEAPARSFSPTLVVGISRGGVVPATMLSQRLALPLRLIQFQRGAIAPSWMDGTPTRGERIVVVDDMVSTGRTMYAVRDMLRNAGNQVMTAALFVDYQQQIRPDLGHTARNYIRFPWERKESSPLAIRQRIENDGDFPPEAEQDYFGLDLDGVLAPDLPLRWYERHREELEIVLAKRDSLLPLDTRPQVPSEQACIITGRPECDVARTRAWLERHGFGELPLYCRPDDLDPAQAWQHKAETIDRIGVSVFFESDLMQALRIAHACPAIDIVWWGRDRRWRVNAADHAPPDIESVLARISA